MAVTFRIATAFTFLILFSSPGIAQTPSPPSSAQGFHSKARLLSGGKQGDIWLAGIEISLDQGFKTYWRHPGESGLPPRFDWSGSENAAFIDVQWPAPERYQDAAGVAHVYGGRVILPVRVKPADPAKPVKLRLSADYGICKDICIPARAELSLPLSEPGPDRAAIEQTMAKVPRPQELGAQNDLSILSVTSVSEGGAVLSVTVRVPAGSSPALFAEGPENWYFSSSAPNPESDLLSTESRFFTVAVEEKPKDAVERVSLRLTLVAGGEAVETYINLDGNGLPR